MKGRYAQSVVIASVVLAGLATGAHARRFERETRRTLPVEALARLDVENAAGRTVIVGRDGLDAVVVVEKRVVHARDDAEAERRFDAIGLDVERDDDTLRLVVRRPERVERRGLWSVFRRERGARIDLAIEVPRSVAARVRATSGDVRVSDLEGDVAVSVTSGDATVRAVRGAVRVDATSGEVEVEGSGALRVNATSGDVRARDVDGDAFVATTSGEIVVRRVSGALRASASSGDVDVRDCAGAAHVETSSGDVRLRGVRGGLDVVTASGDVDAGVVADAVHDYRIATASGDVRVSCANVCVDGMRIDVSTASGTITGEGPIEVELTKRNRFVGRIGRGRAAMRIETASGDVTFVASHDRERHRH